MSIKTKIEWVRDQDGNIGKTWNPIAGCSKVSQGCKHCYAETMASRLVAMGNGLRAQGKDAGKLGYYDQVITNGRWNGKIVSIPEALQEPFKWKKPYTVFVNSMSDLFHENVEFETIYKIFEVMLFTPRHTYQILTKRANRLPKIMRDVYFHLGHKYLNMKFPLPNVWLGVSVEDQANADERIPYLLNIPASVRFLSCEPLLSSLDIAKYLNTKFMDSSCYALGSRIDWVIVGGESGHGARPMHPDWARGIRDQCIHSRVSFFFKQWGEWQVVYDRDIDDPDWQRCPQDKHDSTRYINLEGGHGFHGDRVCFIKRVGKSKAGRVLDGRVWDEMPEVSNG